MNKTSSYILRIGLAITFVWIGVLIFKAPEAWGGYISPWALKLLPIPIKDVMLGTAVLDVVIGIFLLFNSFVWIVAGIASIHLIIVLIVSGINEGTVRDIGILAGTIALALNSLPEHISEKFRLNQKKENT